MSGRSPSGVASLRARFEQNADPESLTPSRGRSPAGSITSDTSRPLSKVRTSFISVGEPSGHMDDLLGGKEAGKPIAGDGAAEESQAKEHPKLNGTGPTSAPREVAGDLTKASEDQDTPKPSLATPEKPGQSKPTSSLAAEDLEKPTTGGQDIAASALPPHSTNELTASGGEENAKDSPDLGSILKGSAFQKEEAKKEAAAKKPVSQTEGLSKKQASPISTASVKPPTSMEKAVNGKPKESQATQSKIEAKPVSEQSAASRTQATQSKAEIKPVSEQPAAPKAQTAPKPTGPVDPKPPNKEPEKKDISTKAVPAAPKPSDDQSKASKTDHVPSASTSAPAVAVAPKKEGVQKKPQPSKESAKPAPKEVKPSTKLPAHKSTRPTETSGPSNPKTAPIAAPSASKPLAKKSVHPTSPPASAPGVVKPKPRSPTRPVNLPAHLTAQTAASAAKYGDDSHVEPHKDQPTSNAHSSGTTTTRAPTHPPLQQQQQRKPPRASMPAAGSSRLAAEKEKSKPRMSVAGGGHAPGTGSSSSFLERMMRPTQSSAQKTHDRAETGKHSPPRKVPGSRNVSGSASGSGSGSGAGPKTVTGASTHKPDLHARNDGGHGEGREKHAGSGVGDGGGKKSGVVGHGHGHESGMSASVKGGKEHVAPTSGNGTAGAVAAGEDTEAEQGAKAASASKPKVEADEAAKEETAPLGASTAAAEAAAAGGPD